MIAAQQYFIEFQADLNMDRLLNLLPNYIPDYCLTNVEKSIDRWAALIVQAYKKVNICSTTIVFRLIWFMFNDKMFNYLIFRHYYIVQLHLTHSPQSLMFNDLKGFDENFHIFVLDCLALELIPISDRIIYTLYVSHFLTWQTTQLLNRCWTNLLSKCVTRRVQLYF